MLSIFHQAAFDTQVMSTFRNSQIYFFFISSHLGHIIRKLRNFNYSWWRKTWEPFSCVVSEKRLQSALAANQSPAANWAFCQSNSLAEDGSTIMPRRYPDILSGHFRTDHDLGKAPIGPKSGKGFWSAFRFKNGTGNWDWWLTIVQVSWEKELRLRGTPLRRF